MTKETTLLNKATKTFKGAKIMIWEKEDGVYIRLAGNVDKGELFSLQWIKVYDKQIDNQFIEQQNKDNDTI